MSIRTLGTGVVAVALLSGCVFTGSESDSVAEEETDPAPGVSVQVPPERLSAFCVAMIDLSDRARSDAGVDEQVIIETYRSIAGVVPPVIADDFALVLEALENDEPPPTDPPRATIETVPRPDTTPAGTTPVTSAAEATGESAPPVETTPTGTFVVDERFDRDDTPAQRLNSYVSFSCRDADNNPGPPATQPLKPPSTADGV